MYEAAQDRLGPGRALAVGDRLDTDVAGARSAGLDQALVLTGATVARRGGRRRPAADARGRLAERAGARVTAHRGLRHRQPERRPRPRRPAAAARRGGPARARHPHRVERTTLARPRTGAGARGARPRGGRGRVRRRRPAGRRGGRAAGHRGRARGAARRPRKRLRAQARRRGRPRGRLRRAGARRRAAGWTSPTWAAAPTSASPRRASTPTSRTSPTPPGSRSAAARLPYATLRALQRWRPAHWSVQVDGEAHAFRGYSVAVANSGVFGGGMRLVPRRGARRRPPGRRAHCATSRARTSSSTYPGCSGALTSAIRGWSSCAAARSPSRPTARSWPTRTAIRSARCRPPSGSRPRALRVLVP